MKRTSRAGVLSLVVLAIVIVLIYAALKHLTREPSREASLVLSGPPDIYPDRNLTPGATNENIRQDNIGDTICNPSWSTRLIRPPQEYTNRLKHQQIEQYDYADESSRDYEEDHLIPLELGGSPTDPKNLWPEPYRTSIPDGGARFKDQVENYLHKQVCAGDIPLNEAQKEIATDWYRVYVTSVKRNF
jgi:hypothetical protein